MDYRTNDTPRERQRSEYPVLRAIDRACDASGRDSPHLTNILTFECAVAKRLGLASLDPFQRACGHHYVTSQRRDVSEPSAWCRLVAAREAFWNELQYNSARVLAVAREVIEAQCAEHGIDPAPVLAALDAEP